MKAFLDEDFILQSEAAKTLYHKYAESEPIFDFHNHLSPQEIFENKTLGNLANAWLDHDHYKWRAMRAAGVPEELITGHIRKDGSVKSDEERGGADAVAKADYERYLAFVRTLQLCVGNPLYHWSHLELKRYFGISEPVTEQNARQVWDKCNALLAKSDYAPRGLLAKMSVRELCTTDDPLDTLEWHKKLADDSTATNLKVRPSFRPDLAINADCPAFADYIARLEKADGTIISSISDMLSALGRRMDFFKENGSVVSDHSLENDFYLPASAEEVNELFKKARAGKTLSHDELAKYKGFVLIELGKLYAKKGFVMQIHIGALRDQNSAMLNAAGKNIGEDSLQDFNFAPQIGAVLNAIYSSESAARTIVYNLNPKDNEALATMAANFRNCQFGPAWWFNDHKDGIEEQIRVYSRTAPLGRYVGMLTDSRSFLSYPRHEYFRRILCNQVGKWVEDGEFPNDDAALKAIVEGICFYNAKRYFGL